MNKRLELLVVDDEPITVKRLKAMLENVGYSVAAFTDSEAALHEIRNKNFDLIITDFKMKNFNGINIIESANEKNQSAKCIIISGLSNEKSMLDYTINNNNTRWINKPFKLKDLLKEIEGLLNHCG